MLGIKMIPSALMVFGAEVRANIRIKIFKGGHFMDQLCESFILHQVEHGSDGVM